MSVPAPPSPKPYKAEEFKALVEAVKTKGRVTNPRTIDFSENPCMLNLSNLTIDGHPISANSFVRVGGKSVSTLELFNELLDALEKNKNVTDLYLEHTKISGKGLEILKNKIMKNPHIQTFRAPDQLSLSEQEKNEKGRALEEADFNITMRNTDKYINNLNNYGLLKTRDPKKTMEEIQNRKITDIENDQNYIQSLIKKNKETIEQHKKTTDSPTNRFMKFVNLEDKELNAAEKTIKIASDELAALEGMSGFLTWVQKKKQVEADIALESPKTFQANINAIENHLFSRHQEVLDRSRTPSPVTTPKEVTQGGVTPRTTTPVAGAHGSRPETPKTPSTPPRTPRARTPTPTPDYMLGERWQQNKTFFEATGKENFETTQLTGKRKAAAGGGGPGSEPELESSVSKKIYGAGIAPGSTQDIYTPRPESKNKFVTQEIGIYSEMISRLEEDMRKNWESRDNIDNRESDSPRQKQNIDNRLKALYALYGAALTAKETCSRLEQCQYDEFGKMFEQLAKENPSLNAYKPKNETLVAELAKEAVYQKRTLAMKKDKDPNIQIPSLDTELARLIEEAKQRDIETLKAYNRAQLAQATLEGRRLRVEAETHFTAKPISETEYENAKQQFIKNLSVENKALYERLSKPKTGGSLEGEQPIKRPDALKDVRTALSGKTQDIKNKMLDKAKKPDETEEAARTLTVKLPKVPAKEVDKTEETPDTTPKQKMQPSKLSETENPDPFSLEVEPDSEPTSSEPGRESSSRSLLAERLQAARQKMSEKLEQAADPNTITPHNIDELLTSFEKKKSLGSGTTPTPPESPQEKKKPPTPKGGKG